MPHVSKSRNLRKRGVFIMKRIEYKKGQKLGNCIYLNDVIEGNEKRRSALFRCKCGKEFVANIFRIKSGHTKSCGCLCIKYPGFHGTKTYQIWYGMKSRCYNKNVPQYKHYGERNITICNDWLNNIQTFHDYIIDLPNAFKNGYSLDRINVNGNYEPRNVRWATNHIQRVNQEKRKTNTSGFVGVSKSCGKYTSSITVNRNRIWFGYFKSIQYAVNARNNYIIKNKLWEYKIQLTEVA